MIPLPAVPHAFTATVSKHTDGDTIHVVYRGNDDTVRLLGINTPETVKPGAPVECWGPQASADTAALLPIGSRVTLRFDRTQDVRDRYQRILAYVYWPGHTGANSVNRILLQKGDARVYVFHKQFRYWPQFMQAQASAQIHQFGLWGHC